MEKTPLWQHLWRHPGHLLWVLAAYLPWLGSFSVPLTGDQKAYLNVAAEMRDAGQWLTPLLFGEPSYLKPPLQYWATLLGWEAFGFGLWGALLPSVLALAGTCAFLGAISRLLRERPGFVDSGLWFAATVGALTYGTTAQMEIWVCLFQAAAWWAGLRYLSDPAGARRARWLYLAFAIAGLGALVKSPLYSVFWVLGFTSYLLVAGEWEIFAVRHLYGALFSGMAVGSAWFAYAASSGGERFWAEYLLRETWEKKAGNQGSVASLWAGLLYQAIPLTLLVAAAARTLWRGRRTGAVARSQVWRFLASWAWAPALFFTFYPYRVKTYLFILVPALAVFVDWGFYRGGRGRGLRWTFRATGLCVAAGACGLAGVLWRAGLVEGEVALGLAAAGAWAAVCSFQDWERAFALAMLGGILCVRAAAAGIGEAEIAPLRAAVGRLPAQVPVVLIDEGRTVWNESGWLGAALGRRVARVDSVLGAAEAVRQGGLALLTEEQTGAHLPEIRAIVGCEVGVTEWPRLAARGKFPFRQVVADGARVRELPGMGRRFAIVSAGPGCGGGS